uniref:Uncharacterized protein n=1 Tax=Arundo donax TaxID=35708 RepID=A0A0A9FQ85_ARUDO
MLGSVFCGNTIILCVHCNLYQAYIIYQQASKTIEEVLYVLLILFLKVVLVTDISFPL